MKKLLTTINILEVPLYLLLLGGIMLDTNVSLSIFLFTVSLFRLWTNINFNNNNNE